MSFFKATEHNGHLLYGEVTETYAGTVRVYVDDNGVEETGRIQSSEEISSQHIAIEGCYDCGVEFEEGT